MVKLVAVVQAPSSLLALSSSMAVPGFGWQKLGTISRAVAVLCLRHPSLRQSG